MTSAVRPAPGTPRAGRRTVLVAGAGGVLAIELVQRLLEDPSVAFVIAAHDGDCPPVLLGKDPARFHFARADLSRRREVDNLFLLDGRHDEVVDTVVHLAFQGNPLGYSKRVHEFNVNAARHLLDTSLRHRIGKLVFLSSDAVYKIGPRGDYRVAEDAEINLDPSAHPIVRDTIDAEFLFRAKMDHPEVEVMVLRPSGVFGGGVVSGLNLLFESRPPVLPVGFDPMINPTTKERLATDLWLSVRLHGKGLYNVAGSTIGPLSRFLEERGLVPLRVPGFTLRMTNKVQRIVGRSRYHAGFHPHRLYFSLVLDDRRFEAVFRANAGRLMVESPDTRELGS